MAKPSETLYPGESLYPSNDETNTVGVDWNTSYSLTADLCVFSGSDNTHLEHYNGWTTVAE